MNSKSPIRQESIMEKSKPVSASNTWHANLAIFMSYPSNTLNNFDFSLGEIAPLSTLE